MPTLWEFVTTCITRLPKDDPSRFSQYLLSHPRGKWQKVACLSLCEFVPTFCGGNSKGDPPFSKGTFRAEKARKHPEKAPFRGVLAPFVPPWPVSETRGRLHKWPHCRNAKVPVYTIGRFYNAALTEKRKRPFTQIRVSAMRALQKNETDRLYNGAFLQ